MATATHARTPSPSPSPLSNLHTTAHGHHLGHINHHRPTFAHLPSDAATGTPLAPLLSSTSTSTSPSSSASRSAPGGSTLFRSDLYEEKDPAPRTSSSSSPLSSPLTSRAPAAAFPPAWNHNVHDPASRTLRAHHHARSGSGGVGSSPSGGGGGGGAGLGRLATVVPRSWRDRVQARGKSKEGALGRWIIIGWIVTTVMFLVATAFWKGQLFAALDRLSASLFEMGYQGLVIFGVLIFITTIPPLPLYSTLIVLSGYTFGVWRGFVASYIASLVGAVVVFVVSRTLLRDAVTKCLASSPTATSLLQILPQKPHLLLLIRVAPYPYNLLNVILASAPSLTLQTYTACTALSLCKLVLHTWIGAGIHDLSAAYNALPSGNGTGAAVDGDGSGSDSGWADHTGPHSGLPEHEPTADELQRDKVKAYMTWVGITLCVGLFFYLTHLAKRALAQAQEEQQRMAVNNEEEVAFLTPLGDAQDGDDV